MLLVLREFDCSRRTSGEGVEQYVGVLIISVNLQASAYVQKAKKKTNIFTTMIMTCLLSGTASDGAD